MQQYEYRVATLEPGHDTSVRLNILGKEGWELVLVIGSVLYLKRPKTNQEKK